MKRTNLLHPKTRWPSSKMPEASRWVGRSHGADEVHAGRASGAGGGGIELT